MKNIAVFMHVPFEGLGCIEQWITKNNHSVTYIRFYEKYELPDINAIDWLIVMGGPMGVYDETIYSWLSEEKAFIKQAIENGKTVLGICLGSQMIAEVLGAKVYPNKQKEIGWFDVALSERARTASLFDGFEDKFPVFHWHGDTFDLPNGSMHLISSEVCKNQAYLFNNKVLGLQFHFEVTAETLRGMVENGTSELIEGETIQSADKILSTTEFIGANNLKMHRILDNLAK